MTQMDFGLEPLPKKTHEEVLLDDMNPAVRWGLLLALIQLHARGAFPQFPLPTMLRIYCLQLWWSLSDPAMEEGPHERLLYRRFAGPDGVPRIPDETTILRSRHLREKHELAPMIMAVINASFAKQGLMLSTGRVVDATVLEAPRSTKIKSGKRDPEMHQNKEGDRWHFGMKMDIGVGADSGAVQADIGTAANVNDVTRAKQLLHRKETDVFANAGYQGVERRTETQGLPVQWHEAMRPGKRAALISSIAMAAKTEWIEKIKASIRAKVEHPFRLIKLQFGHAKVRYLALAKNTALLQVMFELGHLWTARKTLLRGALA